MKSAFFIHFETHFLFKREVYFFTYKSVRFKLFSGTEKNCHCLATILDGDLEMEAALNMGLEFLSCLAFSFHQKVNFVGTAAMSGYDDLKNLPKLSDRKPNLIIYFTDYELPRSLPILESKRDSLLLGIYREALSSENLLPSYEFFSYWRIAEVINSPNKPEKLIYKCLGEAFFKKKNLQNQADAEEYLREKLRHAIGHSNRGKKKVIDMNKSSDILELNQINIRLRDAIIEELRKRFPIYNYFKPDEPGKKKAPTKKSVELFNPEEEFPRYMTELEYNKELFVSEFRLRGRKVVNKKAPHSKPESPA